MSTHADPEHETRVALQDARSFARQLANTLAFIRANYKLRGMMTDGKTLKSVTLRVDELLKRANDLGLSSD